MAWSRKKNRHPVVRAKLALRNIEGNLCFTTTRRGPGSCSRPSRGAFRSDTQCEQLLCGVGDALAWLAGHRLHLRVTTRPTPQRSGRRGWTNARQPRWSLRDPGTAKQGIQVRPRQSLERPRPHRQRLCQQARDGRPDRRSTGSALGRGLLVCRPHGHAGRPQPPAGRWGLDVAKSAVREALDNTDEPLSTAFERLGSKRIRG